MTITVKELKKNIDKYLELSEQEDIFIVSNNQVIAQLSKPKIDKIKVLRRLVGIAGNNSSIQLEDIKEERLKRQYSI